VSRRSPRPLALALDGLTEALAPATTLARVQQAWEQAVGPVIAAASLPTAERDGVLTVTCTESVWASELDLMGSQLVGRLNQELGAELVVKLRCRTG
jgi:predicted nucleic acid-binding Zn ribbon protein